MKAFVPRGMSPSPPGMGKGPDGNGMIEEDTQLARSRMAQLLNGSPREKAYSLDRSSEEVRLTFRALAERLRTVPGRKSVFWITEGFPPRVIRNEPAWSNTIKALND